MGWVVDVLDVVAIVEKGEDRAGVVRFGTAEAEPRVAAVEVLFGAVGGRAIIDQPEGIADPDAVADRGGAGEGEAWLAAMDAEEEGAEEEEETGEMVCGHYLGRGMAEN